MTDLTIDLPGKAVPLTQQQFENVGAAVEEMCRNNPKNLNHFRDKIERCRQWEIEYEDACHEAIRQANEFELGLRWMYDGWLGVVRWEPRLRCERPDPPMGPGYTWQEFRECDDFVVMGGKRHQRKFPLLRAQVKVQNKDDFKRQPVLLPPSPLSLWLPPLEKNHDDRLLRDATPKPQGEVLLVGYYALLAAIRDRFYDKRVSIIDTAGKGWPVRMLFGLIVDVGGCPDVKQCEVEMALAAVRADLAGSELPDVADEAAETAPEQAKFLTITEIMHKLNIVKKTIQSYNSLAKKNRDHPWNNIVRFDLQRCKVIGYEGAGILDYRSAKRGTLKRMGERERFGRGGNPSVNPVSRSSWKKCSVCGKQTERLMIVQTNGSKEAFCVECYNDLPAEVKREVIDSEM